MTFDCSPGTSWWLRARACFKYTISWRFWGGPGLFAASSDLDDDDSPSPGFLVSAVLYLVSPPELKSFACDTTNNQNWFFSEECFFKTIFYVKCFRGSATNAFRTLFFVSPRRQVGSAPDSRSALGCCEFLDLSGRKPITIDSERPLVYLILHWSLLESRVA